MGAAQVATAVLMLALTTATVRSVPFGGAELIFLDVREGSEVTEAPQGEAEGSGVTEAPQHDGDRDVTTTWDEPVDTVEPDNVGLAPSPPGRPHGEQDQRPTGRVAGDDRRPTHLSWSSSTTENPATESVDTTYMEPVDTTDAPRVRTAPTTSVLQTNDTPTEQSIRSEAVDTLEPVATGSTQFPSQPRDDDVMDALPSPAKTCVGVKCSISTLLGCTRTPVLFADQCCPVCPRETCRAGQCPRGQTCTVHNGRPICCTEMTGSGHHRRHDRRRESLGEQSDAEHSILHLPERYDLENNCTVVLLPTGNQSPPGSRCSRCRHDEACETRFQRYFNYRQTRSYVVPRPYCCRVNKGNCPVARRPAVLGRCHLPGRPVPRSQSSCLCGNLAGPLAAYNTDRQTFGGDDIFVTTAHYRQGRQQLCLCRRSHRHGHTANQHWLARRRQRGHCRPVWWLNGALA